MGGPGPIPSHAAGYEHIPYPVLSHAETHPDRLATIAWLLGIDAAPPERCRVLEIGCAGGGNLIPMAESLPAAELTGIDVAGAHVREARRAIAALGLRNVRVEQRALEELQAEDGPFDYVIAHGLYSWVPAETRQALLTACRSLLAPGGVAYVSYNALPGWRWLGAIRDMLLFRTRFIDDPIDRARTAREFVDFLADHLPDDSSPWSNAVLAYRENLRRRAEIAGEQWEALLLHDELSAINEPSYVHDFLRAAEGAGLQYLAEADLPGVVPRVPADYLAGLGRIVGDVAELEQYLDFFRNRTFRQTLLCQREAAVTRRVEARPDRMARLHVASAARVRSEDGDVLTVETQDGDTLRTNDPLSKAALRLLIDRFPGSLPYVELVGRARREASRTEDAPADQDEQALTVTLLKGYLQNMQLVELHAAPPAFVREVSARPQATAFARHRVASGDRIVTNRRHERVPLSGTLLRLLPLLDGTRDLRELDERLQPPQETAEPPRVDVALAELADRALLIA